MQRGDIRDDRKGPLKPRRQAFLEKSGVIVSSSEASLGCKNELGGLSGGGGSPVCTGSC